MLNVSDLENKHARYKLKRYIPYIIILISIVTITVTMYIINTKELSVAKIHTPTIKTQTVKKLDINTSTKKQKTKITINEETIEPILTIKKTSKNKKVILSPSLDFMKSIQSSSIAYYDGNNKVATEQSSKKTKTIKKEETNIKEVDEVNKEEPKLIIKKKTPINIKRNKQVDDIQHVIKRFKVNNNPALSLFVAKKYYKLGEYKKAYNYALITNQINSNIEASWIIFAKSLMKLNEQDMAIKTLKKYIDDSHSSRAKLLLDEIQSGKFR